ncbi:putative membrane protein [Escherichia coli 1-250-04_S3_C1]|uniref:Membrane protein n=1 Tax=Escherichia coli 1-250-04_S3_C1 TaxID=1444135 RepID=A0AAN4NSU6_ECOLX|nr:putative membrane protein [Escherichia coli 1-250-04_S3_C1]KEO31286.1 putative membrane protein [Escherichia coli 1-250-04_S3_C2]
MGGLLCRFLVTFNSLILMLSNKFILSCLFLATHWLIYIQIAKKP